MIAKAIKQIFAAIPSVFLIPASASAATVFEYGPSTGYVSANTHLGRTATSGGTGTVGDPYVYLNAFSDTSALTPSSGYSGVAVYGGYKFTSAGVQAASVDERITNNVAGGDVTRDMLQVAFRQTAAANWDNNSMTGAAVVLFKQESFATGFNTGAVAIDGLSAYVSRNWGGIDIKARWVVENDGQYYVSSTIISSLSGGGGYVSLTGSDFASATWAVYNPAADISFNAATATFSSLTLDSVTAVGLYFYGSQWHSSGSAYAFGFGVGEFKATGSVTVVPEPGITILMLGAAIFFVCLIGRHASRFFHAR